ncbi:MAG: DUF4357 domain-containing protein [Polyangiaceae bacterium]
MCGQGGPARPNGWPGQAVACSSSGQRRSGLGRSDLLDRLVRNVLSRTWRQRRSDLPICPQSDLPRKSLREAGVLVPTSTDAQLRFAQEYAFDSPSAAAGVVTGTGLNGRAHWKVKSEGISYKEWQERQVADATT